MLKTDYRHLLLALLLALLPILPARAALTGVNIEQTLSMLRCELTAFSHSVDSVNNVALAQRARYMRDLRISSRVNEIIFLCMRHHGLANMMPDVRTRMIETEDEDTKRCVTKTKKEKLS